MSLSEAVRGELAAIEPRRGCCRLAELSALARTSGTLHLLGRGAVALHLDVGSASVARRAFSLLRSFDVAAELRTYRRRAFDHAARFELHLGDDAHTLQVLNEAGVLDAALSPLAAPPRRVVARSCCGAAYLRGALLAGGSVSGPPNAHLELRTATLEGSRFLVELAGRHGIELRSAARRGHAVAYAKGSDTIAELLGLVGAHDAVLALREQAVVSATRARANREANADHANLVRASRAAQRQLRAIRTIQRRGQLEALARELQEVAELRLRNPSRTLAELAALCVPPTTKASVHRRLRRLERMAGS